MRQLTVATTAKKLKYVSLALIALVFLAAYPVWTLLPHKYDPGIATTAEDVGLITGVPTPSTILKFRVATYRFRMLRLNFVRISGDPNACLAYASAISNGAPLLPLSQDQVQLDSEIIKNGDTHFRDLSWLDLPYAPGGRKISSNRSPTILGCELNREPEFAVASVRVDKSAGVAYFIEAN